ncbi:MAG: beta-N-acetylhexosaminidase [Filomicrobium sp.]
MRSAFITGLVGERLSADEKRFLAETRPAGIILFARNCQDHDQIKVLVADAVSAIAADDVLILIDQEGGRVQRLRPPLGRALPPARAFGALFATDPEMAIAAARHVFQLLARDLRALGINTDCAPVLDIPVAGADGVIGDRAYGETVGPVVTLGRAVAEGLMAGGVVPVIKHVPGHGRATCDSHLSLPVVNEDVGLLNETDFAPFCLLADMPTAMTAHVVYSAVDPNEPATTSRVVIEGVIRGHIGFDGLLMSDDLSMKALKGPMQARAEKSISAGCDVALHCNGEMAEMQAVAEGVPELTGPSLQRFKSAWKITESAVQFDADEAEAALQKLLLG